jgi:hypothetical protein
VFAEDQAVMILVRYEICSIVSEGEFNYVFDRGGACEQSFDVWRQVVPDDGQLIILYADWLVLA